MLDQKALDTLFLAARTQQGWRDEPVHEERLRALYDLMRWGPTAANCSPARIVFVVSDEARERLLACMDAGNVRKTASAPVTAIIGMDMAFYDKLPTLFPHANARDWYVGNEKLVAETALRNASLQGGYFILAARALGLDCAPMSGFDAAKLNAAFFAGTSVKANFVCALGYGDPAQLKPRGPRLSFEEACSVA